MKQMMLVLVASMITVPAFAKTVTCETFASRTTLTIQLDAEGNPVHISGTDRDGNLHVTALTPVGPASDETTKYSFREEANDANCTIDLENPARLLNATSFMTHLQCTTIDGQSNQDNSRDQSGRLIPGEMMSCTVQ